jgi:hypothetical protein
MFRRLTTTAVVLAGFLGAFVATPSQAHAQFLVPTTQLPTPAPRFGLFPLQPLTPAPIVNSSLWLDLAPGHVHRPCHYQVLVRHGWHWDIYAEFTEPRDAERLARRLQWRGHDVRIRRVIF